MLRAGIAPASRGFASTYLGLLEHRSIITVIFIALSVKHSGCSLFFEFAVVGLKEIVIRRKIES